MANYGYIEFLKNAINNYINIIQDDQSLFIIYCLDVITYNQINQYIKNQTIKNDSLIIKIRDLDIPQATSFNSSDFFTITSVKFKIILESLMHYQIIHFFDPDVYFFSNPRDIICQNIYKNDFVFQQDSPRSHGHDIYSNYVCTGNFTIKSNDRSKRLLQRLIELSEIAHNQNDQEILYNHLNSHGNNIKEYSKAHLEVYDPVLFQNGLDAFQFNFHKNDTKICIHANHMIGKHLKKSALQSINAWTLSN